MSNGNFYYYYMNVQTMDEAYANEVAKRAVARACVALGFKYCQDSALESLADILRHYIASIGSNARDQAEVSGRSAVGIQDLILAIESPKPKSTTWKDLRAFASADSQWNQPFPFEIPFFPVDINYKQDVGESSSKNGAIPTHLPSYPPAHTYKKSISSKKRIATDSGDRVRANKKVSGVRSAQQSLALIEDSLES